MPEKIKKEDGTEVEVFTPEEVAEREQKASEAAVKKYQEENPDKTEELTEAKKSVENLTKELEEATKEDEDDGGDGDTPQIKRLNQAKQEAEGKVKELLDGVVKDVKDIKESRINDLTKTLLGQYSKGDKELEKKIEVEFKDYRPQDISKEGIEERMAKAYQLATGQPAGPSLLDNATGGGSKGFDRPTPKGDEKYNDNEKAIAKALGITPEEMEKYGKKKV